MEMIERFRRLADWEPSEFAIAEIETAEARFESGVLGPKAYCLIGFELDYRLELDDLEALSDAEILEQYGHSRSDILAHRVDLETSIRQQAIEDVASLKPTTTTEAERQQSWLAQAANFSLAELATYVAYSQLSTPTLDYELKHPEQYIVAPDNLENTAEYRFGQDEYQEGYYDNKNCGEVRTIPGLPHIALARRQRIMDTFTEVAHYYGLTIEFVFGHTNFSVWTPSGDGEGFVTVHNLETPDGVETSSRAAMGMLEAIKYTSPIRIPAEKLSPYNSRHPYAVNNLRTGTIRVLPDRFELRPGYGQKEQIDRTVLALMSGFLHGVLEPTMITQATIKMVPGFKPSDTYVKKHDLHILRLAEHSMVGSDGFLLLEPDYAEVRPIEILRSLIGYAGSDFVYDRDLLAMGIVRTIRFENGTLVCDPQAFHEWLDMTDPYLVYQLQDGGQTTLTAEYITDRLRSIRFDGKRHAIEGQLDGEAVTPLAWHRLLQNYIGAAAVAHAIPLELREQDVAERANWFSAEEAVREAVNRVIDNTLFTLTRAQRSRGGHIDYAQAKTSTLQTLEDIVEQSQVIGRKRVLDIYRRTLRQNLADLPRLRLGRRAQLHKGYADAKTCRNIYRTLLRWAS